MAVPGGDGSIILRTKVDDSGLSKGLSGIKSAVGKIGGVVAGAAAAVAGLTTAFVAGVKSTAEYGDRVDKLSQKIGMSKESFQQWDYIMQINGSSIETLQVGMKTLSQQAQQGSDAFTSLGLSQEFVKNASPEELFESTITALQEMEESTERTAIASTLLGRSATELAPLLNSGAESVEALKQQAIDYGMVMTDEVVVASAAFEDSLTTLSMTATGLKNKMMGEFLPSITSVTNGLALLFTGDMSGLDQINEGVTQFVGKITEILPQVLEIGGFLITSLASALIDNLPKLLDSAIEIITSLATYLLGAMPQILEAGIQILLSLIQGISSAIPDLLAMLPDIIVQLVTTLIDNAPLVLQAGNDLLLAVVTGVSEALPQLISYIPTIVTSLVDVLLNNLPLLIDGGIQLLLAVITGIVEALPQLIAMAPQIVVSVAQTIGKNLPQILSAGKQIIQTIINGISSLLSSVVSIGRNIVQGIWNGISGATSWLIGKIQGFCSNALGAIKSFFGIHSPSRVTRDEVGKPIVQGIAVGIDKAKGLVVKAIDSLLVDTRTEVQKVLDELNAELLESEKLYAAESERLKDSTSEADRKYLENLREVAEKERKIYDARQRDIENLKESVVSAYSDMAEEALDSISELQAQQQNLTEKLSAFGGLMTTETRRERGKDVEYTVLADLEEQTATLAAYYKSLQAVKNRGNIPQEFFAVIRDMSIEEGTEYANALLKLTNEEFAAYVEAWSKKQDIAEGISKQLYATETGALVEEIEKQFSDMEEDFFTVGTGAAEEFEAGFVEQLKGMIETIKATMSGAFANVAVNDFSFVNIPVGMGVLGGRVLPSNQSFAAATSGYAQPVSASSIEDVVTGIVGRIYESTPKKEEHYYLDRTELMSLIYDLAEGGKRLQGKSLATGGTY